jgi:hypothetical protein
MPSQPHETDAQQQVWAADGSTINQSFLSNTTTTNTSNTQQMFDPMMISGHRSSPLNSNVNNTNTNTNTNSIQSQGIQQTQKVNVNPPSLAQFALQQQQQRQEQVQWQQSTQTMNSFDNQTQNQHHVNIQPRPNPNQQLQLLPKPEKDLQQLQPQLPQPSPMAASSIHVTTASYVAPKPQNRGKKTARTSPITTQNTSVTAIAPSSSSVRKPSSPVKLAAVPTQKLASKSIISLNLHSECSISTPKMDPPPQTLRSTGSIDAQSANQSQQSTPAASSSTHPPTSDQVDNRQTSSYSSACNATILAQQELLKDATKSSSSSTNISSDENKRQDNAGNSSSNDGSGSVVSTMSASAVASTLKRASPTHDGDSAQYKYVKVVGGKSLSPRSQGVSFFSCSYLFSARMTSTSYFFSNLLINRLHLLFFFFSSQQLTLKEFVQKLLTSRGYSNQHYCSLEGGYYCKPTELQKASYGMTLIKAIRNSDENLLKRILKAGLSPNPCNAFGESTIHMVCRRGDHKLLKIFLDHGCSVQVSDDFGRTPLHDACWTTKPCFKSVQLLLNRDPRLLHVVDCRGADPLSYVKEENWGEWMNFLDSQKEVWWPHRDTSVEGEEGPPPLVCRSPHSMPLPDPPKAALCEHAKQIASGLVEPEAFMSINSNPSEDMDVKLENVEESQSGPNTNSAGIAQTAVVSQ